MLSAQRHSHSAREEDAVVVASASQTRLGGVGRLLHLGSSSSSSLHNTNTNNGDDATNNGNAAVEMQLSPPTSVTHRSHDVSVTSFTNGNGGPATTTNVVNLHNLMMMGGGGGECNDSQPIALASSVSTVLPPPPTNPTTIPPPSSSSQPKQQQQAAAGVGDASVYANYYRGQPRVGGGGGGGEAFSAAIVSHHQNHHDAFDVFGMFQRAIADQTTEDLTEEDRTAAMENAMASALERLLTLQHQQEQHAVVIAAPPTPGCGDDQSSKPSSVQNTNNPNPMAAQTTLGELRAVFEALADAEDANNNVNTDTNADACGGSLSLLLGKSTFVSPNTATTAATAETALFNNAPAVELSAGDVIVSPWMDAKERHTADDDAHDVSHNPILSFVSWCPWARPLLALPSIGGALSRREVLMLRQFKGCDRNSQLTPILRNSNTTNVPLSSVSASPESSTTRIGSNNKNNHTTASGTYTLGGGAGDIGDDGGGGGGGRLVDNPFSSAKGTTLLTLPMAEWMVSATRQQILDENEAWYRGREERRRARAQREERVRQDAAVILQQMAKLTMTEEEGAKEGGGKAIGGTAHAIALGTSMHHHQQQQQESPSFLAALLTAEGQKTNSAAASGSTKRHSEAVAVEIQLSRDSFSSKGEDGVSPAAAAAAAAAVGDDLDDASDDGDDDQAPMPPMIERSIVVKASASKAKESGEHNNNNTSTDKNHQAQQDHTTTLHDLNYHQQQQRRNGAAADHHQHDFIALVDAMHSSYVMPLKPRRSQRGEVEGGGGGHALSACDTNGANPPSAPPPPLSFPLSSSPPPPPLVILSASTVFHPIIGPPVRLGEVIYPLLRPSVSVPSDALKTPSVTTNATVVDSPANNNNTVMTPPPPPAATAAPSAATAFLSHAIANARKVQSAMHANTGPIEWCPFFGPPVRRRVTAASAAAPSSPSSSAKYTNTTAQPNSTCSGERTILKELAPAANTLANPTFKHQWIRDKVAELDRR